MMATTTKTEISREPKDMAILPERSSSAVNTRMTVWGRQQCTNMRTKGRERAGRVRGLASLNGAGRRKRRFRGAQFDTPYRTGFVKIRSLRC